jgi:UDP-N-acetylmuramoyl-tripeptide--D-alanyl-D-alanine ligase
MALNAAAALLAADSCGVGFRQAAEGVAGADLPPMRMQVVRLGQGTVILDTYNASPDSTVAALKTFDELPVAGRRLAVLGEMRELGNFSESGHRAVGKALADSRVDRALLLGCQMRHAVDEARRNGQPDSKIIQEDALKLESIREFLAQMETDDVTLVKGSRALGLERALEGLRSSTAPCS